MTFLGTSDQGSGKKPRGRIGAIVLAERDRHRALTVLALVGVLVAASMAVLGLPPVDVHGPLHWAGIMDPGCGGTRSARLTMLGQWGAAWNYNPAGILAVVGAVAVVVRFAVGTISGRWLDVDVVWTPHRRRLVIVVVAVLLTILEVRQQGRADLLLGRQ